MNTDKINSNYTLNSVTEQIVPRRMYTPLVGLLNMLQVTAHNGQTYKERYVESLTLESIRSTLQEGAPTPGSNEIPHLITTHGSNSFFNYSSLIKHNVSTLHGLTQQEVNNNLLTVSSGVLDSFALLRDYEMINGTVKGGTKINEGLINNKNAELVDTTPIDITGRDSLTDVFTKMNRALQEQSTAAVSEMVFFAGGYEMDRLLSRTANLNNSILSTLPISTSQLYQLNPNVWQVPGNGQSNAILIGVSRQHLTYLTGGADGIYSMGDNTEQNYKWANYIKYSGAVSCTKKGAIQVANLQVAID